MKLPKPIRRGKKPPKPIARHQRPRRVRLRTGLRQSFKAPLGKLRELADDMQSLYVRHVSGWVCWVCTAHREQMQAAHLFAKSEYRAGRYLFHLENLVRSNLRCLCSGCHKYWTHRPDGWLQYLESRIGRQALDTLRALCQMRHVQHDYALVAIDYRQRLLELPDLWKVQEPYDKLITRGQKLGVFK